MLGSNKIQYYPFLQKGICIYRENAEIFSHKRRMQNQTLFDDVKLKIKRN